MGRTLNTKPLTIVLQHDNAASERAIVAMLKASLDLNPSQHYKQTSMIIGICKWAVRNNIDTRYSKHTKHCKEHWGRALSKHFLYQNGQGVNLGDGWTLCGEVSRLVVDAHAFKSCLECSEDWLKVESDLRKVVMESQLGRVAFEQAYVDMMYKKTTTVVDTYVQQLYKVDVDGEAVLEVQTGLTDDSTS